MPAILRASPRGTASRSSRTACQAHLATCDGRPVGHDGRGRRPQLLSDQEPRRARRRAARCITNDRALADRIKRLRNGGQTSRYHHDEFGVNSRLDEMQAAILRARLTLPAGVDGAPPRARPPAIAPALRVAARGRRPDAARAAGARRRATSITCSRCSAGERDALAGAPRRERHRDADPLSRSRSRASPRWPPRNRPTARSPIGSATKCSRCRSIRTCPTPRSTTVSRRSAGWSTPSDRLE